MPASVVNICHPERSAAEFRILRLLLPFRPHSSNGSLSRPPAQVRACHAPSLKYAPRGRRTARQGQVSERIKEPFNEAEQQKRRSVEVSAGFFERVAILSAGSTAVLASLILAIANKYNIHTGWAQLVVHHLLLIAFALGASLILAVLHNFFAALVARADAAIAESQLLQKISASASLVPSGTQISAFAALSFIPSLLELPVDWRPRWIVRRGDWLRQAAPWKRGRQAPEIPRAALRGSVSE